MNLVGRRDRAKRAVEAPRGAPSWLSLSAWERHVVSPMKDFVGAVLGNPPPERRRRGARAERAPSVPENADAPRPEARRALPCDLYLTMGAASLRVFGAGTIDEFAFFQRYRVSDHHDTEFLTRLDKGDRGTENFKAWGVFRLRRPSQGLEDLERDGRLRRTLRGYGLARLPLARQMASEGLSAYDPIAGEPAAGWNRLEAPSSSRTFKKVGERSFSYGDVLEILRQELTGAQKVAWIEAGLPPPPAASPLVHRYYLDAHKQAYLVRERRGEAKRLYLAETSGDALAAVLSSGRNVRRFAG